MVINIQIYFLIKLELRCRKTEIHTKCVLNYGISDMACEKAPSKMFINYYFICYRVYHMCNVVDVVSVAVFDESGHFVLYSTMLGVKGNSDTNQLT